VAVVSSAWMGRVRRSAKRRLRKCIDGYSGAWVAVAGYEGK